MCPNSREDTECGFYESFKSMEVGDLGQFGTPAVLPVVEGFRPANVSAMIPLPNMEERSVLVMLLVPNCATKRPAQLVRI